MTQPGTAIEPVSSPASLSATCFQRCGLRRRVRGGSYFTNALIESELLEIPVSAGMGG